MKRFRPEDLPKGIESPLDPNHPMNRERTDLLKMMIMISLCRVLKSLLVTKIGQ